MQKKRRHFASKEKLAAVCRHLVDEVPAPDLCEELGLDPSQFYHWQQLSLGKGEAVFERPSKQCRRNHRTHRERQHILQDATDILRPGWRERQAKRKSPWNILCVVLGFVCSGVIWYALCQLAWVLHVFFYPEHKALEKRFWNGTVSATPAISCLLMMLAPFFAALPLGFICGNCVARLIPPARRAMNAEAAGHTEITFAGANADLLKKGWPISAVCIILSIIGCLTLRSLE